MLVLSRKVREQIRIGPDVTITVCRIAGGQVKIGIEAPSHVSVMRAELPRLDAKTLPLAAAVDRIFSAAPETLIDDSESEVTK